MIGMTAHLGERIERDLKIELADEELDDIVAANFLKHLQDNGFEKSALRNDSLAKIHEFIRKSRDQQKYSTVVSLLGRDIVGTTGCQLYDPPYPVVFPDGYMTLGYVWGVYVEPSFRGHGIGTKMTRAAIAHLKTIGCTRVLLHASTFGHSLYERIGFVESDEMKLNLLSKNC